MGGQVLGIRTGVLWGQVIIYRVCVASWPRVFWLTGWSQGDYDRRVCQRSRIARSSHHILGVGVEILPIFCLVAAISLLRVCLGLVQWVVFMDRFGRLVTYCTYVFQGSTMRRPK